jgi:hypothetical protein
MLALAVAYIRLLIVGKKFKNKLPLVTPSQSSNLLSFNNRVISLLQEPEPKKTQTTDYVSKTSIRAIVVDNQMYWISDNAFYTATLVNGNIEENSTRLVDTMTMDKVQLEKIMFIVDKLREGD